MAPPRANPTSPAARADFVQCPRCALELPAALSYCPRCRAQAQGKPYDPRAVDAHERHYVFTLVALTLGALAIPRALRSPAFSPAEKAGLALLGLLNTGGVVVVLVLFVRWLPLYLQGLLRS